jgi:hypothetical protein
MRGHPYLAIWVEGAFHTAAPDVEAVLKDEPEKSFRA